MNARIAWSSSVRRPHPRQPAGDPWMVVAAIAFFALLLVALFGARIAPHEPIYFVVEHGNDPRPYDPGVVFPFGSDVLGRDIFSLVLSGAGATLTIVVVSGLARVVAGALVALASAWWVATRVAVEVVAAIVSAVPATLMALVIVKTLIHGDPPIPLVVGALLVTGWAGPYRVIRTELDRLQAAPFSQGATAIGIGRWRLFWRHQLPHAIPALAMNACQQMIASMVLVAELGVLGVFVGATRVISIEESITRLINGQVNFARVPDPPEWGGLLAGARTIESLWTTRWLILAPGIAFALSAVAIAALGYALAHRYARHDIVDDIRRRPTAALVLATAALVGLSWVVPERYAGASQWANAARSEVANSGDTLGSFAEGGLRPIASSYAIERDVRTIAPTGPTSIRVGSLTLREQPRDTTQLTFNGDVRPFINARTGGGTVEAPLVYVGRGIVPSEHVPTPFRTLIGQQNPELATLIKDYPDDYASIDLSGKVALLLRFYGVTLRPRGSTVQSSVLGFGVEDSIASAIKRGAAAVIFIDPSLRYYTDEISYYTFGPRGGPSAGVNPYLRSERDDPPRSSGGTPVVVISDRVGAALAAQVGIDISTLTGYDAPDAFSGRPSIARDLGMTARVEVPLAQQDHHSVSYVGEVPGSRADAPQVLVWAVRKSDRPAREAETLRALARALGKREVPFVLVDFDPGLDPLANTRLVTNALASRPIALVVVVKDLTGSSLKFTTPAGELIAAFDLYAQKAGARATVTRDTASISQLADVAPLIQVKTIVITGDGEGDGDLRADAAALLGYVAGRLSLGAEELPR